MKSKTDVYQKVTDLIIERLEQGHISWENPVINNCRMQNLITGHIYRGINPLILSMSETPYFMTFKQAKAIGAKIKKGAKSLPVVYWNITTKIVENNETGEEEEKAFCFLKYYNVFNITDIENIPEKYLAKTRIGKSNVIEIKSAEEIIKNYPNPPEIKNYNGTPCYSPSEDVVRIPRKEYFKNSNHFYSTVMHELAHSTGHEKRLNRFKEYSKALHFGNSEYAKEELTAELSASFLLAETGESINIDNKAAYIQNWLKALKNDKRLIITAAARAEKATEYILGVK